MAKLLPLIDEAVAWLRHNSMCEAQPPQRVTELEESSCGWWPERELVEGKGSYCIFVTSNDLYIIYNI